MKGVGPIHHAYVDRVFGAVAIGAANADRQRDIWKRLDEGAEGSVRSALEELLQSGRVLRREKTIPSGFAWLWWREA